MGSLILVLLRVIAILPISTQLPVSVQKDVYLPNQLHPKLNPYYDNGLLASFIGDGDAVEEMEDSPISSGPTEYPLSFGEPKSNKLMSFGQAVILAKENAKCLNILGSQMNKTGLLTSTNNNGRPPIERLYIPYGCFKSDNAAQCNQCINLTAQLITNLDECQQFCEHPDKFCNHTCSQVYNALRNESRFYDAAQALRDKLAGSGDELDVPVLDREMINNITRTFYDPTNPVNNYSSGGSQGKPEIPKDFFGTLTSLRAASRLILSPQVFCEGVYGNDEKSPHNKKLTGFHFVVLKWDVNETALQMLNNKSQVKGPESSESEEMDNATIPGPNPLVFVIEQKSGNDTEWITIGKTPYGLQTVNVSFFSDVYQWRITAVGPNGIEDVATMGDYVTLDGYKEPNPPKKIRVAETEVKHSSVNVLIEWEPPDEKTCFYKLVLDPGQGERAIASRIRDKPLGVHMHWFQGLKFGTLYNILITSRDAAWRFQSNQTKLEFKTPSCLEAFNFSFDKCAPPSPRDIKADIEFGPQLDQPPSQVILRWLPPLNASESNPVTKYVVVLGTYNASQHSLSKMEFNVVPKDVFLPSRDTKNYTLPGNTTVLTLKNLKPDSDYTVEITAYSSQGRSPNAQHRFSTRLAIKAELSQEDMGNWLYLTIGISAVAFSLLMCNVVRVYIKKRKVKKARNQYFQSMEDRDVDWSLVPLNEEGDGWNIFDENFPKESWEIPWSQLTMGEVIGQGAFGIVRRAKITRKKLEAKLRLRGEDETWFNSSDRTVDESDPETETVAVKMVKVSSTRDDEDYIMKEITMMQNLGFHPQIVSLLGACTRGRSLCLVLEYCSGGDLLTFVRKVRAKYWPTLGLFDGKMDGVPFTGSRPTRRQDVEFSRRTYSESERTAQMSSVSTTSDNRKSTDSSPINYADIGGFSESLSSPDSSSQGFQENFIGQTTGNSFKAETCNPQVSHNGNGELEDEDDESYRPIDEKDVLSYARQIALAMEYLEKNRCVHRDLACRNVLLLNDYKHVKISDFGLSRDIYTRNVYHQKSKGKMPLKWMAIESIFTHTFTTKSDVWSYGILLWELLTLGGTPYPGLGNQELFHLLRTGYRMQRPENCSEELYALMKKCWRTAACDRPTFSELRQHLEVMMEAADPNLYLSLMKDIPADYFHLSSKSDIPLVGKDDENIPLEGPSTATSSVNLFPKTRHRHSITNGAMSNPNGSKCAGGEQSQSHYHHRKSHSLYHNTTRNNKGSNLPCTDESFTEPGESFAGYRKKMKQRRDSATSTTFTATASPDPNSSCGMLNTSECGDQTPNEVIHKATSSHQQHGTNNSTSGSEVICGKAHSRFCLDFQEKRRNNSSFKIKRCVASPDSGINVNRDLIDQCDSTQVSIRIEEASSSNDADKEDSSSTGGNSAKSTHFVTDVNSIEEAEGPPKVPPRSSVGESGGNMHAKNAQGKSANNGKQPKSPLPFVNVNEMTIIENRSYDLRDA